MSLFFNLFFRRDLNIYNFVFLWDWGSMVKKSWVSERTLLLFLKHRVGRKRVKIVLVIS